MDGLSIITPDENAINNPILQPGSSSLPLKREVPLTNEAYIWHLRLGHINSKRIQILVDYRNLSPLDFKIT